MKRCVQTGDVAGLSLALGRNTSLECGAQVWSAPLPATYFTRIWHGVPMGERCSQSWRRCGQGQSAVPARTREPCACGCQRLFFPAVANLLGKLRSKLVWRSMVSAATKAR
jgi:hypothetical protein